MAYQFLKIAMACSLIFTLATQASAAPQDSQAIPTSESFLIAQATTPAAATPADGEQKGKVGGPRKQLATIIFAGLGGALLGLSTLSFYGRPQDYLANIPIGAAVGIIAGTAYVTFKAATNPAELYGPRSPVVPEIERQQAQLAAGPRGGTGAPAIKLNLLDYSF